MKTCQEVSRSVASDALATAGWRERLSIKLHLLMCRHCRRYARQLEAIGGATRRILSKHRLDHHSRERLRSSILNLTPDDDRDDSNLSV
jgi:anti-sigma factor ChrR (cupin superfamily)